MPKNAFRKAAIAVIALSVVLIGPGSPANADEGSAAPTSTVDQTASSRSDPDSCSEVELDQVDPYQVGPYQVGLYQGDGACFTFFEQFMDWPEDLDPKA